MFTRTVIKKHRHTLLVPIVMAVLCMAVGVWLTHWNQPAQAGVGVTATAGQTELPGEQVKLLADLLNPDGTLNTKSEYTGSVDPTGWRMEIGAGGEPRFVPAGAGKGQSGAGDTPLAAGDENWDTRFGAGGLGLGSYIYAITASGTDVYVGGSFATGGPPANYLRRWNGSAWSTLGGGVTNPVRAIAVSGTDVYVGGDFTTAGESPANRIAKWDGSAWSALGSGVNNTVFAIAVSGTDVYVGGIFTTAGGLPANRIAKWDGSTWSALDSGLNSTVFAIAMSGADLYAGGNFTTAGGVPANYTARWDGSTWSALGSGLNGSVSAMAVSDADMYVGGFFTTAGGLPANRIARWNGNSWSALGSGLDNYANAIAVNGANVYVGGGFSTAGGVPANHIAKWNGSVWSALGSGVSGPVFAIAASVADAYVGGGFSTAGNVQSYNFGIYHEVPQLVGHVTWQGMESQPSTQQMMPITLTLTSGSTVVDYPMQVTDASGFFTASLPGLPTGSYAWKVKGPAFLANSGTVPLSGSLSTGLEMGAMRAGDVNDDNLVEISDFNLLRTNFGQSGAPPLRPNEP